MDNFKLFKLPTGPVTLRILDHPPQTHFLKPSSHLVDCQPICPLCDSAEPKERVHLTVLKQRTVKHKFRNWMKRRCYHERILKKWGKKSPFQPSVLGLSRKFFDNLKEKAHAVGKAPRPARRKGVQDLR